MVPPGGQDVRVLRGDRARRRARPRGGAPLPVAHPLARRAPGARGHRGVRAAVPPGVRGALQGARLVERRHRARDRARGRDHRAPARGGGEPGRRWPHHRAPGLARHRARILGQRAARRVRIPPARPGDLAGALPRHLGAGAEAAGHLDAGGQGGEVLRAVHLRARLEPAPHPPPRRGRARLPARRRGAAHRLRRRGPVATGVPVRVPRRGRGVAALRPHRRLRAPARGRSDALRRRAGGGGERHRGAGRSVDAGGAGARRRRGLAARARRRAPALVRAPVRDPRRVDAPVPHRAPRHRPDGDGGGDRRARARDLGAVHRRGRHPERPAPAGPRGGVEGADGGQAPAAARGRSGAAGRPPRPAPRRRPDRRAAPAGARRCRHRRPRGPVLGARAGCGRGGVGADALRPAPRGQPPPAGRRSALARAPAPRRRAHAPPAGGLAV